MFIHTCIFYRDDNENNYPVNKSGRTKAIANDTALPGHKEEHAYETIKFQYTGSPTRDCLTIKSDLVSFSKSGMCHGATESGHHDKTKSSTRPKCDNVPKEAPVAKSRNPIPTIVDSSLQEEEDILPDSKYAPDDYDSAYVIMHPAKNDQYTSLSVTKSKDPVYETLKY